MKAPVLLSWLVLGLLPWSIALPTAAAAVAGTQLRGTLYALGSGRKVKLYTWEMTVCPDLWTSRYRRFDGTLVVEDFTHSAGSRLAEYGYERRNIGERSSVRVQGSRLEFQYQRGTEKRAASLTTNDAFLTGPAVFLFIQRNLPRLLAGEEVEFKYGVLDRLDYYTFALSTQSRPTDELVVVRIRATSFFVRMAIDPIYVTLSRGGKFKGIRGRTILMEPKGDGGVPIDADLVVESETPAVCGSAVAPQPAPGGAGTGTGSKQ